MEEVYELCHFLDIRGALVDTAYQSIIYTYIEFEGIYMKTTEENISIALENIMP